MLSSAHIFDENAGAQGPQTGRRGKEVKGLQPQKGLRTPFTANRRALGDISNQTGGLRGAPATGSKAPGIRLFEETPAPEKSSANRAKADTGKAKAESRPLPAKAPVVEDIEYPAGRLGGDGSPPPLHMDLGFDIDEVARRLEREAYLEALDLEPPASREAEERMIASIPDIDVDSDEALELDLLNNLDCAIEDLDAELPEDLTI